MTLDGVRASADAVRVQLDEGATEHAISPHALHDMILPAPEGH